MDHSTQRHSQPTGRTAGTRRLAASMTAGTVGALIAILALAAPSTAAAGGMNEPIDPSSLNPPVPANFNASCLRIGNHISCSLAFSDPDIVDDPSGIVCDDTELLVSQSRSVVGTRLYDADGNLLQRHFIETFTGNFTNPATGKVALWNQHDTVIHNLAVPGDDTTGTEHVSGLLTRTWLRGGGTIIGDTGTMITDTDGNPLTLSGHHPFLDFFVFGDTTALDPLCAALD